MKQMIASDVNNDIITVNGNIRFLTGINAVLQNCKSAMLAQRGEMMYALTSGMPWRATTFDRYDPRQFEAAARDVLLGVTGVVSVLSFNMQAQNGVLTYATTIQTIYGNGVING
jgi:hypothetical protein